MLSHLGDNPCRQDLQQPPDDIPGEDRHRCRFNPLFNQAGDDGGALFHGNQEGTALEHIVEGGELFNLGMTLLAGPGNRLVRTLKWLAHVIRQPLDFFRVHLLLRGTAKRTTQIVFMQTVDDSMGLGLLVPTPVLA